MLPGKVYKPEDVLQILRRRIWLLLVPFSIVSAATATYSRYLPDIFRSETLILVVPQRVPESYVRSTVTTRIEDRLQSISQQILSRTRLERIIQDFNLYVEQRRTGIMEDIVEQMRRDIVIQVVKGDAFRVSYTGQDPRTVMKVTDRLASLFIEENLRDREVLAEGTNQFLEAQLEDSRRRLIETEKKLESYRKQFSGQLPSQLESNLQVVANTQMQIRAVVESMNRDRDRHLMLERQLAELENPNLETAPAAPVVVPANSDGTGGGSPAQQLEAAKVALTQLQLRLKSDHPDVLRVKRIVANLQAKADAEAADAPVSPENVRLSPVELLRRKRIADVRAEFEQLNKQIASEQAEEKRLRQIAAGYQQRVELAPTRESEMIELTRDYETLQKQYTSLLSKKEESQISANLERRQIGEQFKLLDPARLPERPTSPNRQQINTFGLVAGLAIGIALIVLVELRDTSFKTDEDLLSVLGLPVLAVVPLMQSNTERRRTFRLRLLVNLGLGTTVAACLAVVTYTFVR
jgi:polysaccharide chain length determinant protein (PEP-CTERM system associated)